MGQKFTDLSPKEQKVVIGQFYDLFAGRLETYALRIERGGSKAMYVPSNHEIAARSVKAIGAEEFTEEVVRAHLDGSHFVGVYPITTTSDVRWFAMDFDASKDDPDAADPWDAAMAQATTLVEEAGLMVYIERSQSGNGYHVWGFLDRPVNAGRLRHALHPLIENTDTYDRMFPNQDGVNEVRPLGNLIALPLHGDRAAKGNSCFVKRGPKGRPVPYENQFEFLADIELNSVDLIDELFEKAGEYVQEREMRQFAGEGEGLPNGWKVADPRFGCEWVRWCFDHADEVDENQWYALACNFAQLSDGRDLFHLWSEQDTRRYSPNETDQKYNQALEKNSPHGCDTIRRLGGNCKCDERFPGEVYHPFDLAKIPYKRLVESIGLDDGNETIPTPLEGFDAAIQWAQAVQDNPNMGAGHKYGIESLDKATGMRDGDLIIFAARPGIGKTAMAMSVMHHNCMQQVNNYMFSMEMSTSQLFKRALSTATEVSQTRMATGAMTKDDWQKVAAWQRLLHNKLNYPLFVDDLSRSTDRIWEVAANLVHKRGKGIVWVDYLQLAQRLPRESMFDAITRIVHDLKMLAKALQVPVVALTQLNRGADETTVDVQPQDSWLRGSGDIEQAADVIIFMLGQRGPGVKERDLYLHKERHREGGLKFTVEFNQPLMKFGEQGTWQVTQNAPAAPDRKNAPRSGDEERYEGDEWGPPPPSKRRKKAPTNDEDYLHGL